MATTQDDGGNCDRLDDTPEMRHLLGVLRKHSAPQEKLERLVAATLTDKEGSAEVAAPDGAEPP